MTLATLDRGAPAWKPGEGGRQVCVDREQPRTDLARDVSKALHHIHLQFLCFGTITLENK